MMQGERKRGDMMIKKIKAFFDQDNTEVDLSRRKFITTAAALAALTVVATKVPSLLKLKEIEAQIASGRVFGQTFYTDETVIINIDDVVIDSCEFIATAPMEYMMQIDNVSNVTIQNCIFNGNGYLSGGISYS